MKAQEVFIVSAKRTPIGGFLGNLAAFTAAQLGAIAIDAAMNEIHLDKSEVGAVFMGNVLSAGTGQSPARQAAIFAGLPFTADATTINKVCASGMKAVIIATQELRLGQLEIAVAGGMESMSNVPHFMHFRKGRKFGEVALGDGILIDGLTDAFDKKHMGVAAELCVRKYEISRQEQDQYTITSYEKALAATEAGKLQNEIVPVQVGDKLLFQDEDIFKLNKEKVPQLKPVFEEGGTITAANASNLNDGAAALILASAGAVEEHNLKPLVKIIGYADAAQAPEWYTTSPSIAIPKALANAGVPMEDVDIFEINEAYAAVALANQKILNIPAEKLNIYGGAVAFGHPLGMSGARIICTLISALKNENKKYGVAAICNGGGGASAIVIQNLFTN